MADISLNQKNLQELLNAFDHYFPENTVYSSDKPFFSGEFNWNKRTSFIEFVNELIKESGIRIKSERDLEGVHNAQKELVKLVGDKVPEKLADTNTNVVETQKLKQFEEDLERQETVVQGIKTQKEVEIGVWIEAQKKLYEQEIQKTKIAEAKLQKEKPVFVKVTVPEQELNSVKKEQIKILEEAANANPKQLIEDLETSIKEKITTAKPENVTPEEIDKLSELTAIDTVEALVTHQPPIIQAAIINTVATSPKVKKEIKIEITSVADILTNQKLTRAEVTQKIADFYFGKGISTKVLGPSDISVVRVETSNVTAPGFVAVRPETVLSEHIQNLNDQSTFLNTIAGTGEREIRSLILKQVGLKLDGYIARQPVNSLLAKTYNSDVVKLTLRSFGIASASPWVAAEGSFVGRLVVSSGFGQVAGAIQTKTGINLGVKLAATKIAGQAAGKATSGLLAKALTTLGALGAPESFGLSVVVSTIISKVFETIPWDKIKSFFNNFKEFFLFGGIATVFLVPGPLGLIIGGAGSIIGGASALATGGLSITGALTAFGQVIGSVFSATMDSIGKPILITFLAFPVIVTLILFIINSGAYVIPPGSGPGSPFHHGGGGGSVTCTTDKGSVEIPQNKTTTTANRAYEIVSDLYQGYWCFWNRPPAAPAPWNDPNNKPISFPNDKVQYPPDYHLNFDYALYAKNPNGDERDYQSCGPYPCMFWCTMLVTKSYAGTGQVVPLDSDGNEILGAYSMQAWFTLHGKFIPNSEITPQNAVSGSAIFFNVNGGGTDHVGEVYSSDVDEVFFLQSNGPTKSDKLIFNKSGFGLQDLGGIKVVGIGTPWQ